MVYLEPAHYINSMFNKPVGALLNLVDPPAQGHVVIHALVVSRAGYFLLLELLMPWWNIFPSR